MTNKEKTYQEHDGELKRYQNEIHENRIPSMKYSDTDKIRRGNFGWTHKPQTLNTISLLDENGAKNGTIMYDEIGVIDQSAADNLKTMIGKMRRERGMVELEYDGTKEVYA